MNMLSGKDKFSILLRDSCSCTRDTAHSIASCLATLISAYTNVFLLRVLFFHYELNFPSENKNKKKIK